MTFGGAARATPLAVAAVLVPLLAVLGTVLWAGSGRAAFGADADGLVEEAVRAGGLQVCTSVDDDDEEGWAAGAVSGRAYAVAAECPDDPATVVVHRFGSAAGRGGGAGGLGDLLGGLFGGGAAPGSARARSQAASGPARGQDVETEATLSFEEAVLGVTVPLRMQSPGTCPTCAGSGARPGTSPHTCPVCQGAGVTSRSQGAFAFSEPCRNCRGSGSVVDDPCPTCSGSGVTTQTRTITVRIPAGVKDGQRIRLAGKGAPGRRGGPAGDLFVVVHVSPHELFARTGDDLTLTVPITFGEATLGTTLTVPTLDGNVSLRVPAGTASGQTLRVRGRGVTGKSRAGDLLVTVEVAVPKRVSAAAEQAIKTLEAELGDPRPRITAAVSGGGAR
ncbi:DnaJ C-terminal domain-containing protein [Blastococcus sp. SYSU D00695]